MTNYQMQWNERESLKRRFRRDKRNPKRKNWCKTIVDMGNLDYVRFEEGYPWIIDSTEINLEDRLAIVG